MASPMTSLLATYVRGCRVFLQLHGKNYKVKCELIELGICFLLVLCAYQLFLLCLNTLS